MEIRKGIRKGFQSLPHEIITQILCRLPVESIIICKRVCKTWYSLINHNYFVKLHLTLSSSSNIIFETAEKKRSQFDEIRKSYLLFNVKDSIITRILQGSTLVDMPITCSLDGLICFSRNDPIDPVVIRNPFIRGDYVFLPQSNTDPAPTDTLVSRNVTLGFDDSINKYKVIRMLKNVGSGYCSCEVITIGNDTSWRQLILPYEGFIRFYRWGVYHRGSIYWLIEKKCNDNGKYILEFDLRKEVFAIVSFPDHSIRAPKYFKFSYPPGRCRRFNVQLQSLGEYLSLIEMEGQLLHIWRLAKQNNETNVVGFRSIRIQVAPYMYAGIIDLIYPTCNEDDFLFLQTLCGGNIERLRGENGETRFCYYYPCSKKNNRCVHLPSLEFLFQGINVVSVWCFKPSLVSIKAAMLNH